MFCSWICSCHFTMLFSVHYKSTFTLWTKFRRNKHCSLVWNLLFSTVCTIIWSFHVWCVSVNSCFVNCVCANRWGIKELIYCKKWSSELWKNMELYRIKFDFLYCILCDNSITRITDRASTTNERLSGKRMKGEKKKKSTYMKYVSHVSDSTRRYANAVLSVGSPAIYVK